MNKDVNEAISELEESIANENKLIELLKQFEQLFETGLSEMDYHAFCETNMRCSDFLGKALVKVFPFLIYEKKGANHFSFRVQEEGYTVCIPSYCHNCVEIVVDKYYWDKKDSNELVDIDEIRREKEIAGKEAFLSTHSILKRSRIIYPCTHPVIAFLAYIFSGIGRNRKQEVSAELVNLYKKQKEEADKKSELIRQEKLNRDAQQAVLSRYISLFLKWTNTVFVYPKNWREPVETHKRTKTLK